MKLLYFYFTDLRNVIWNKYTAPLNKRRIGNAAEFNQKRDSINRIFLH